VDGTVTPQAPNPEAILKAAPAALPSDAQSVAGQQLTLAKLYLSNRLSDKARDILEEIIAKYPQLQAAAEARELLGNIPGK